ncbi:ABC transporter substrate-binding protein [Paenibacillus aurantiacus]|uniref:ABC transporter substrate-binding protein n=1 Tax=Paenibacillus aurantiacus TaxID=1936118 RepID=A0ABV5KRN9_9BACL
MYKKQRLAGITLSFIISASLLAGCGNESNSTASTATATTANAAAKPFERVIQHAAGETTLTKEPSRIALLDYSYADYVAALDVKPTATVTFVENEMPPYLADRLTDVQSIGAINAINLEALMETQPDLIIGVSPSQEKTYDQMSQIADTILLDQAAFDWRKSLTEFGTILGKEEKAQQVIADYDKKAEEAREEVAQAVGDQTVMFLRVTAKEYRVYGNISPSGSVLYGDLGLKAVPGVDMNQKQAAISMEMLPELNPDHIFLLAGDDKKIKELQESALWKNLNAVKNNHIYPVDQRLWIQGEGPLASETMLEEAVQALTNKSE